MNNLSSAQEYSQALPFAVFVSDEEVKPQVGSLQHSPRVIGSQISPRPIIEPRIASRYDVDVFGRPRFLSKWEIALHAMAWPILIGVLFVYGLAICVVAMDNSLIPASRAQVIEPHATFVEVEP